MKTNTIILASLLILQVNSLFASSDGVPVKANKEMNFSNIILLVPVTPKEATFEETLLVTETIVLAPVTPKEATFGDKAEDIVITCLAPQTPAEADFNDDEAELDTVTVILPPVTPAEADFPELP